MDGAKIFAGCTGWSCRAQRATARKRPEKGPQYRLKALELDEITLRA